MSIHRTGPGLYERRTRPPSLFIYNFDIGGDEPKREHRVFLIQAAVPVLQGGGSVSIVGLASRRGSTASNQALSERRASRTLQILRDAVPKKFAVNKVIGVGEMKAQREGYRDNTEDPRFRSVILFVTPDPTPPLVPDTIDISPEVGIDGLIPGFDVFDFISKTIDITQGVAGLVELLPWGAIAEFAGALGPFLGMVSAIIQMPLLWKGVHDQNLANGGIEGFWDAMQDMAVGFSNRALLHTPLSRWPPIAKPKPHFLVGSDMLLNEKQWMQGRTEGCEAAYKAMMLIEKDPIPFKITVNGRTQTVPMGGRMYLYTLWVATHGQVADAIHKVIDKKLRDDGKKEWPLREF
jgi:hypothetical protein